MSNLSYELRRLAVLCQTGQPWQTLPAQLRSPALQAWIAAASQTPSPQLMLRSLSLHCHLSERLRNQARRALLYPRLVMFLVALLLAVLVWTVPGLLEQILLINGRELPGWLAVLLSWPGRMLFSLLALVLGAIFYARSAQSQRLGRWLSLRLRGRAEQALWCNCVSLFLGCGQDLPAALQAAAQGLEHPQLGEQAAALVEGVRAGSSLSSLLEKTDFDWTVVCGVQAGEDREELSLALADTCATLEAQLEQQTDNLITMIQPAALAVVGLIVLLVHLTFWLSYAYLAQRVTQN